MFRRRRRDEAKQAEQAVEETMRESGPWDADEPHPDHERIDLGGLRVPQADDLDVRLASMGDQHVGVLVLLGDSTLQLQALAAPKSGGIWSEVRTKVAGQLKTANEREGVFGPELVGEVESEGETRPIRYLGVDGPRWLLLGVVSGPAAQDETIAARFEDYLRDVVVVRGQEPMAREETIPLRRPNERPQQEDETPQLDPFRRGPEISEIR
ncbi:DUF3710 domain-containing protein [Nonomuraea sp. NPDC050310]|uniref:DUF3710 domain-containing protein n=1 Tax=Nonomuraea sp. NPDC050310 TaxID=3154935 RepID=UPI003409DE49